jgi:hypothetical protein
MSTCWFSCLCKAVNDNLSSSSPNVVVVFIQEVPPSAMKGEYERERLRCVDGELKNAVHGRGVDERKWVSGSLSPTCAFARPVGLAIKHVYPLYLIFVHGTVPSMLGTHSIRYFSIFAQQRQRTTGGLAN